MPSRAATLGFIQGSLVTALLITVVQFMFGVNMWDFLGPAGALAFWFGVGLCWGAWREFWYGRFEDTE